MGDIVGSSDDLNQPLNDQELDLLQVTTLLYYLHESNPDNWLIRDKTDPNAPVSIAACGMSLATIPIVVERDVLFRDFAAKITRKRLRYLLELPQGPEPDSSSYKGFFYHFLDIESGRRVWQCELSTIDSAFLFAGALTVGTYFDRDTPDEVEIRNLADELYSRADWNWARNGGPALTHGWRPENGFIQHRYQGYDEGLLLYILGLGSPTHPLPPESYRAYCSTYQWKKIYDRELLYSGPLFTHQLSHMWIDFRGIRDDFMRERGSDYFENSRRVTFVQQEYAIRNPMNFAGYGEHCWGFTACDGPGWARRVVNGVEREFFDYTARGAPFGPDDGTVAPWVVEPSGLEVVSHVIDPTFRFMTVDWEGQIRMDPSSVYAMPRMVGLKQRFDVAFASDTDADRHGIVSRSHGLLDPNHHLSLAISYLFANRPQWSQAVAVGKTVVSSSMIDRLVNKLGLYKIYAESFKDQGHLDAIVSEAQEIVNDALKSFDSAYQQREVR